MSSPLWGEAFIHAVVGGVVGGVVGEGVKAVFHVMSGRRRCARLIRESRTIAADLMADLRPDELKAFMRVVAKLQTNLRTCHAYGVEYQEKLSVVQMLLDRMMVQLELLENDQVRVRDVAANVHKLASAIFIETQ